MSSPQRVLDLGGLKLPAAAAATKTFAILAKRRAGKTYTAAVMAEEFAEIGQPFYVLDPTGAWWGLRSSPSGKRAGLPVVVIGGEHGDVPLEPTAAAGKVIAEVVVGKPGFYVIDLSLVEVHAELVRFSTGYLGRVHQLKAKDRRPLHGFWDEADLFAPQRPDKDETKLLHHAEQIVRRGGIRGEGTTLITQRGAVLNKNVLTQIDVLILLRLIGSQDIAAVEEYVKFSGESPDRRRALLESLPSLEIGEAQVYGPGEEPPLFDRVRIRARRTFNSSATPGAGEAIEAKRLADVDVDALRARMAATIERAEAEDPKRLQARMRELNRESDVRLDRIRQLERELAQRPAEPVEVPVLADDALDALRALLDDLRVGHGALEQIGAQLLDQSREAVAELGAVLERIGGPGAPARVRAVTPPSSRRSLVVASPAATSSSASGGELKAGARRMLAAAAGLHPMRLTRAQLATLGKVKKTGGTFSTYLGQLKQGGYLDENGTGLAVTQAGFDYLGEAPPAPATAEELRELWRDRLKAGARRMLDLLIDEHPNYLSRAELAERAAVAASGGTFSTYLGMLRSAGLIDEHHSGIRAADVLFLGAAG